MIINIIGLPRTGTTVLYQSVFSGINKCDMLVKRDTFLDRWDEPWIFSKQDRGNPEFIKNLSLKIDEAIELGTTGHLVIKTHYGHLSDLKKYVPESYEKLLSVETYNIKIFRANIFDSTLSNMILTKANIEGPEKFLTVLNSAIPDMSEEQVIESIKSISYEIDEAEFLKFFDGYIFYHCEMLRNHLNLSVDDYVLYENLPKTIKGIWESLKLSLDDRFKFDINDSFDVVTKKSFYSKKDLIKNYDNLHAAVSKYNGEYSSMTLTDGFWTTKVVDF